MYNLAFDDIIAAVSTPPGAGGIGIIRVSGLNCIKLCDKIFKSSRGIKLSNKKSHTISYGVICDFNGDILDEVLVSVMKAPNTYTKEDVVEINCHGGFIVVNKILSLVIKSGARLAEPGEFTKRAFVNGRIDLSQAEAVIDIINSKTEISAKSAVKQLEGTLYNSIKNIRSDIIDMIASIEAAIDYPDYDIEEETYAQLKASALNILEHINKFISSFDIGRIIKEGVSAAIIGKPNVGKSSFLNLLLKEERAIVTEIPGTTRDTVEEFINIENIPVKIVDTAGIRKTEDIVEKIGVEKSKKQAESADIIFLILDGSNELTHEDYEILNIVDKKKVIVLVNKSDLNKNIDLTYIFEHIEKENIIFISAKQNTGIEQFIDRFKNMFFNGNINIDENIMITNIRHKNLLVSAKDSLEKAVDTINNKMPEDFVSYHLQDANSFLGQITGDSVDGEIIDRIFTKFCLGK